MKLRDNLSLIVPLGSAIIIFASAIKNTLYFSVYNIAIINYITLTDFFLLIINDAVILIFGVVLMGISYTALEEDENIPKNNSTNYGSQKPQLIPIFIWISTVVIGLLLLVIFGRNLSYGFIGISFVVLFSINLILFLYLKDKIVKKYKEIFSIFATLLSIILIMSAFAFKDVYRNTNNVRTMKFTMILEDETINTDNNLIYVGKTLEYIFLYDKKQDMTRILRTNILKEMRVQSIKQD